MRALLKLVLLSLAAWPSLSCAQTESFESYHRQPYDVARAALLRSGYELVRFTHKDPLFSCPAGGSCADYPELIDCSGTGLAFCSFAFRRVRDGQYIEVTTTGETAPRVHSIVPATSAERDSWPPHEP